jgi:cyclohexanone monooxygenase
MERIRRRIDSIVTDKKTADMLKPWYRFLCKRPCFNDDYLPTFNRPNVTLVDVSDSQGVDRITETAIVANGVAYDVDCIVFASGFEVTTDLKRRLSIETIEGRNGLSLYDHWREGFRTLHGMTTHGFPNQFHLGYLQGAVAAAINLMYDQQGSHIAYIIKEALARGAKTVEVTEDAQDEWVRTIRATAVAPHSSMACTPGYYNNEGVAAKRSPMFGEVYAPGYNAFDDVLKEWRSKGDLAGIELGA